MSASPRKTALLKDFIGDFKQVKLFSSFIIRTIKTSLSKDIGNKIALYFIALLGITKDILEYEMIKLRFVKNTKRLNKFFTFSFFAFCHKIVYWPFYFVLGID